MNRRNALGLTLGLLVLVFAGPTEATAQLGQRRPPVPQVTLFGVLAVPGEKAVDKELTTFASLLQRLLPGHGFKLLDSRSRPLPTNATVTCPFPEGWSATLEMVDPLDPEGKVILKFTIHHEGEPSFSRIVRTPPNQVSFCDVGLPSGNRLVIGIGAR